MSPERSVKPPRTREQTREEPEIGADVEAVDETRECTVPRGGSGFGFDRTNEGGRRKTEARDPREQVFDRATDLRDLSVGEDRRKERDRLLIPRVDEAVREFKRVGTEKRGLMILREERIERPL